MQQQPLLSTTPSPITEPSSSSLSRTRPPLAHLHARQQQLPPPRPSLSPPPPPLLPPPPPPPPPPGLVIPSTLPSSSGTLPPATDGSSKSSGSSLSSTASPKTTLPAAATSTASSSAANVKGEGSSSSSSRDQGLTAGAIVGIAIALHIVLTIVVVLLVRAYRLKHRKRKEATRRRLMMAVAGRGDDDDGGGRRQQQRISNYGSRGALFNKKRESGGGGGSRLTRDTNWIKLQDKASAASAANASDAAAAWPSSWQSSTQLQSSPERINLAPPGPAVLSPTSVTTYKTRMAGNDVVRAGAAITSSSNEEAAGGHRPSYRTVSSCSTFHNYRVEEEEDPGPITAWNDARWNEVLYRTLEAPPRSQAASVVSRVSLGGAAYSYYGDDEEDGDGEDSNSLGPSSSSAARSLRAMHSRRRLVDDYDNYQTNEMEKWGGGQQHEVIRIGHRPEELEETGTEDSWGGGGRRMVVRDAVPSPLRPSTRGSRRRKEAAAVCQSHWSFSS